MELLSLAVAAFVVLGVPALAVVVARRALDGDADSVELVAVAYGGVSLAALCLWTGGLLLGPSAGVALLALIAGALLLCAPLLLTRRGPAARVASDPYTGHHDGRVVPDAVRTAAPRLRLDAPPSNPHFGALAAAGLAFALLCWLPFLTYGWERAGGVHRMAMTDWYKHLITATSLAASDVFPPANPFLHAADAAPYYYGFHLLGAAVARLAAMLAGVPAGSLVYVALLALTLITAFATPFVAYSAARVIAAGKGTGAGDMPRVPLLAALGATFLAGFDLVPMSLDAARNLASGSVGGSAVATLRATVPSTHLDYWIHHNERQFNAPYLTTIWAPQHMAAVLVALLVVTLVIQRRARGEGGAPRAAAGWLLPALLLAGVPALSAYVALGLAIGAAGALLVESLRHRRLLWQQTIARELWLLPGLGAAVAAIPVLVVLASGSDAGSLTVHLSAAGGWSNGAVTTTLFGDGWLSRLIDSVPVYLLELGILGLLALDGIRRLAARGRLLPHQQHVVWMVASILIVVLFVRPPVGGPNNLYARPLVLAWFLLAPFAAIRFARLAGMVQRIGGAAEGDRPATSRAHRGSGRGNRRATLAAVALCVGATAYALVGVLLEGALFWAAPADTVQAARWIDDNAPAGAVVAVAPRDWTSTFGYWLRRPLALADERHALLFGAGGEQYNRVAGLLERARAGGTAAEAAAALEASGASLFLLSSEPPPPWLASACFVELFDNGAWRLVAPTGAAGCAPIR